MLISYDADILPQIFLVGQVHFREPWIHFSRNTNEYILYVIRDGDMYLEEDGIQYHLRAGDVFILEPGLLHVGYRKAPCDYYYVHFSHPEMFRTNDDQKALEKLMEKRKRSLAGYPLEEEGPMDSITYLPKRYHLASRNFEALLHPAVEYYKGREEHYRRKAAIQVHSFLLEEAYEHLLSEYCFGSGRVKKANIIAERLLNYLNQNYAKHLTSQDIAEMFEINFDYINRVFSKTVGVPIFTYLNRVRIHNAKQLIATTDLPFSEIAYLVGIEDRYYFSKLFRKITGVSPMEYYKQIRSR